MNGPVSVDKIELLLEDVVRSSGLDLTYRVSRRERDAEDSVFVEFEGADSGLLVARDAELLLALEHITAKALRLDSGQRLVQFESHGFKAGRERSLHARATEAVAYVRQTREPYAFEPMTAAELGLLGLLLAPYGMKTENVVEGAAQNVVLYPAARPRVVEP